MAEDKKTNDKPKRYVGGGWSGKASFPSVNVSLKLKDLDMAVPDKHGNVRIILVKRKSVDARSQMDWTAYIDEYHTEKNNAEHVAAKKS